MQLVAESTNLIIRGNWNPAILQPAWLVTHVLEKDAEATPVSMEFSAIAGIPPRYTIENLRFAPTLDSVSISPATTDDESLSTLENVGRNLLRCLPHTPISAFGQNFEFVEEAADDTVSELFAIEDRLAEKLTIDVETNSTDLVSSLQIENRVLNLRRILNNDGSLRLKMNFHYATESAEQAVEVLENSVVTNYEIAKEITAIYDNITG